MNKKMLTAGLLAAASLTTCTAVVTAAVKPFTMFQVLHQAEQPTPPRGYIQFWEVTINSRVCTGYTSTSPNGAVTHSPLSCLPR